MNATTDFTTTDIAIAPADLRAALKSLKHGYEKRNTIPVLGTCRIAANSASGLVKMTATDLDLRISTTIEARVDRHLKAAVPFAALQALASDDGDEVGLSVEGEILTMTSDGMTARQRLLCGPEDFPVSNFPKDAPQIRIGESDLHRLLRLGKHCTSTEITRYYLNGTYLTQNKTTATLRSVTTDGHRMAVIDCDTKACELPEGILPWKAVAAILSETRDGGNRVAEVAMTGQHISVTIGDTRIESKLIDGTYPDYTRVIPKADAKSSATLTRAAVERILRMQVAISGDRRPALRLDPERGEMVAECHDGNRISAPMQCQGKTATGFNSKYLADQLRVASPVELSWGENGDPAIIRGEDLQALWVLMPMRV